MALEEYRRKRDCGKTAEPPPGAIKARKGELSYLIQKHDATRLHYDFRLELDGVLLSWAVTKGPSLNPSDKRLAVRTEDHPLSYGTFEGTIPKGQYGGGTVMLWDGGTWEPTGDPKAGLKKAKIRKPAMSANNTAAAQETLSAMEKQYPGVQLVTLVDAMPEGDKWLHAIKLLRYRLLRFLSGG